MTSNTWASVPWVPAGATTGWQKRSVPYKTNATYLHTFDIYVPGEPNSQPTAADLPKNSGPWIIYIHGGAWRDPLVDSTSFEAVALQILASEAITSYAGLISINYPLSSHPNHPTHPSQASDEARSAKHPDHILAVLTALAYLQNDLGVAHDYILAGHSCGATLTFQVAMDSKRWAIAADKSVPDFLKPKIIVGLNGLYDLAEFMQNPPQSHKNLVVVYDSFTKGAFGDDEQVWRSVCPTMVSDWSVEWPEGKGFVVVQSRQDGLVPYSQTELLKHRLAATSALPVTEYEAGGEHNDLWKEGKRLAEILLNVLHDSN